MFQISSFGFRISLLLGCLNGLNLRAAEVLPFDAPLSAKARVVIVDDPQATDAFLPQTNAVREMVAQGILRLAGGDNLNQAWRKFVSTQDVVGIKVFSLPGRIGGTRPTLVAVLVEDLLAAGLPTNHIVIWDKQLSSLQNAGFVELAARYHVRLAGALEAGYDESTAYTNSVLGTLIWGDLEFGRPGNQAGHKSFVTKLLTRDITKNIVVSPLMNHNEAGVNGCLVSMALGSVDNTVRFEGHANRLAEAVPEIYNLTNLYDHVSLNIIDALIGQYQGEQVSLLQYATVLNQVWFSKDPVALDVLALQELERERQAAGITNTFKNLQLYQNAALLEQGVFDLNRVRVERVGAGK